MIHHRTVLNLYIPLKKKNLFSESHLCQLHQFFFISFFNCCKCLNFFTFFFYFISAVQNPGPLLLQPLVSCPLTQLPMSHVWVRVHLRELKTVRCCSSEEPSLHLDFKPVTLNNWYCSHYNGGVWQFCIY